MWLCMHCDFSTFSCYFTETKSRSYFSPLLMTHPNSLSDNVFINALKDASCCPHVLWEHSNCAVAERILATLHHNSSRTWGRVDSLKSSTFSHCNKISLFTLMSPSEEKYPSRRQIRQKKLRKRCLSALDSVSISAADSKLGVSTDEFTNLFQFLQHFLQFTWEYWGD